MDTRRLFYGWWVTIAFAVMVFLSTADIFGRLSVGSVLGMIFIVHQGTAALGSWLGGLLFEVTGGYGAAFGLASAQLLLGGVVVLAVDEAARCVPRLRPVAGGR